MWNQVFEPRRLTRKLARDTSRASGPHYSSANQRSTGLRLLEKADPPTSALASFMF